MFCYNFCLLKFSLNSSSLKYSEYLYDYYFEFSITEFSYLCFIYFFFWRFVFFLLLNHGLMYFHFCFTPCVCYYVLCRSDISPGFEEVALGRRCPVPQTPWSPEPCASGVYPVCTTWSLLLLHRHDCCKCASRGGWPSAQMSGWPTMTTVRALVGRACPWCDWESQLHSL